MPPPNRPSEPERIVCRHVYEESTRRCKASGNATGISMSDMIWGTMVAFRELDRAGFDIVDRRTGKPVPFVDGHIPYEEKGT